MHWNRETNNISLSQTDITILSQCGIPVDSFFRSDSTGTLPPLESVLHYTMLHRDHTSVNSFWADYRRLKALSKNASKNYLPRKITKQDGTYRYLYEPFVDLRTEQEYILHNILNHVPVDSHCYSYRPGIKLADCAEPHVGNALLIHMDIKDFFGSITSKMVWEALRRDTNYSDSMCHFLTRLCCRAGKLPQGAVTSPALSNIVFYPCDRILATLAERYGAVYTRYCDDLYFSGSEELDKKADLSPVFLRGVLEQGLPLPKVPKLSDALMLFSAMYLKVYNFEINTKKTKVRRQQHRQSVLGITVNEKMQATRQYRKELLEELYYLGRFGKTCTGAKMDGDYLHYLQTLEGKVAYVLSIRPDDHAFLAAKKLLAEKRLLLEQESN